MKKTIVLLKASASNIKRLL